MPSRAPDAVALETSVTTTIVGGDGENSSCGVTTLLHEDARASSVRTPGQSPLITSKVPVSVAEARSASGGDGVGRSGRRFLDGESARGGRLSASRTPSSSGATTTMDGSRHPRTHKRRAPACSMSGKPCTRKQELRSEDECIRLPLTGSQDQDVKTTASCPPMYEIEERGRFDTRLV